MIDELETELRDALAAEAATIPPSAALRLRTADYRPRAQILRPPVAVGALVAAGAAGAAVVSVVGLGAGTTPAFAGWSASPTPAAQGQVTSAEAACRQRLSALPTPGSGAPAPGLLPVLTDTRGPFTFVIFASADANASCISGPSFTSVARNQVVGHGQAGSLAVAQGEVSGASSGGASHPTMRGASSSSTKLGAGGATISTMHLQAGHAQPYSFAEGRTGPGVSGATLVLDTGTRVQTSTANGWYVAWWPGTAAVSDLVLTTASGSVIQPLHEPAAP